MVYLGRILKNYTLIESTNGKTKKKKKNIEEEDKMKSLSNLSLHWMIRRMKSIINIEIIHQTQSTDMVSVPPLSLGQEAILFESKCAMKNFQKRCGSQA